MESVITNTRRVPAVVAMSLAGCIGLYAQNNFTAKGTVVDATGEPIPGATVVVKGNTGIGMTTDIDGNFSLKVPSEKTTLVVSFVGMKSQEVRVQKSTMNIVLEEDNALLEEVVVVGYGQQKKASVVGAITQATGEQLTRAAGINDIGSALTGNLPGVITSAGSGMPGEEDPKIIIRGSSSWNNSEPLVLVDGVERPMSSVDMQSVASISVLKDASATAVYGVKGANGVILITTKRGQEGRAHFNVSANAIMKVPSKLPDKYDSYDALMARNTAFEHELNLPGIAGSFSKYVLPVSFIGNYRNQQTLEDIERYPNVDWQNEMFKDFCMSYNANINVSGGTQFVKYFASLDYVNEGDLYRKIDNGRNYNVGYGFHKVNMRSNLDFHITKSTILKMNLAGSTSSNKKPWVQNDLYDYQMQQTWAGAYGCPPDRFLPQYHDGTWGRDLDDSAVPNSIANIATGGTRETTITRLTTDFALEQDLSFVTKGLSMRGMIAWDNVFQETDRGINDLFTSKIEGRVDPETGEMLVKVPYETYDKFTNTELNTWSAQAGSVNNGATTRNFNYNLQLNWARKFGKHDVTAMGLFQRQENAWGNMVPSYREDWVFRTTYNWANRYLFEYNGAYNGSEKFSPEYRFAFFHSGALGWTISEEPFMRTLKDNKIIDNLKLRFSYGEIGDDNVGERFLYMTQWSYGGSLNMSTTNGANSKYQWYREAVIGNPNIHWEVVRKANLGLDYSFLDGLFAGSLEFFQDRRSDILVNGNDRAISSVYGAKAPWANLGEVKTNGYELEIRFNKKFGNWRVWANASMTHSENEVIKKDDKELLPAYQKAAGFAIGQTQSYISKDMTMSMDQLYGTPAHNTSDNMKLVGDYYIVDFNGDGVVDTDDKTPYGFTGIPQNTYNVTLGAEWKGWSLFLQFYGVTNVTRDVTMQNFANQWSVVYDQGTWWTLNNKDADIVTPRFLSTPSAYYYGTQYLCDGSYIRLKNAEIAYNFPNNLTKKIGVSDVKLFLSGNNIWLWTRMPDDREGNTGNGSAGSGGAGAYPTMKRFNLGLKFSF